MCLSGFAQLTEPLWHGTNYEETAGKKLNLPDRRNDLGLPPILPQYSPDITPL